MTRPNIKIVDFGGNQNAPLIVLGPSLGTSVTALWSPAASLLTGTHRVLGWDLPGHGVTPAPRDYFTIGELADAVACCFARHSAFSYAGVSVGGAVGLQMLIDRRASINAAALICTGPRIGEPTAWRERARTVRRRGTRALLTSASQRWFAPGFPDRNPATAKRLLASLESADDEGYAVTCEALADFDVIDSLTELTVPVLAIAGHHDVATPPAQLHDLACRIGAGFLELCESGHLAPAEQPKRVAQAITTLIEGTPK